MIYTHHSCRLESRILAEKSNMEAQQIITMSINKITGSRGQRGGVNLRKNLLVATVLHSARAMYYEEMCNRMAMNAELHSRETMGEEEEDCTEAPDWGDSNDSESPSSRVEGELCGTNAPTEDKENCQPAPTDVSAVQARLEKPEPDSTSLVSDHNPESSPDKERMVLGQKNTNCPSVTGCNACKRKRSDSAEELRDACESILPKRAKSSDSDSQTEEFVSQTSPSVKQNSEGSITSLVTIFKSGFHGLSGEANTTSNTNIVTASSGNHLQQSSYASSMPRPFEQLQMPIAAC